VVPLRALAWSLLLHGVVLAGLYWGIQAGTSSGPPAPLRLTLARGPAPTLGAPPARSPEVPRLLEERESSPRRVPAPAPDEALGPPERPDLGGEGTPGTSDPAVPAGAGTIPAATDPRIEASPPLLLSEVKPPYPREARRRGWEGTVEVSVEVGAQGQVVATAILSSSGHRALDEAAVRALAEARFQPARRQGQAEAGQLALRVTFRLE